MELDILDKTFTICKLPEDSPGEPRDGFFFLSRTDDELSLVCETGFAPERTLARDDGWRGFRIRGVLDFSLIGILADISGRLAREGISIFAVSTYNTDYLFTKADVFDRAVAILRQAGYAVG